MNFQLINPFAFIGMLASTRDGSKELPLGARFAGYLREQSRYRETVRELSRLSDRELDDLGINRVDIPAVARGSAHIDPRA